LDSDFQKFLTNSQQASSGSFSEEFQKINDIWKELDDDSLQFKWVDPSSAITQALTTAGKQDELCLVNATIACYVKKLVQLFENMQKSEKIYARTIAALKEKCGKSGKVSIRIVPETSESIDSALTWAIDAKSGDLWMETRANYWGRHLQSFSAYKLSKIFNTFSWDDRGDIVHVERSHYQRMEQKKTKISAALMEGFNTAEESDLPHTVKIQDFLTWIKVKSGVKFRFDPKQHLDFPALAVVTDSDKSDQAQIGRNVASLCKEYLSCIAEGLNENTIGQQFIAENCKSGISAIRITHSDCYHEVVFKEYGYCTVKWDDGDLVILMRDYANTYEVSGGLKKLTTEPAEGGGEDD